MKIKFTLVFIGLISLLIFSGCKKERGCTDFEACNFNPNAKKDDGTCRYVLGCTDPNAYNYVPEAECSDGSCIFDQFFELYIDFWNEFGNQPFIRFDAEQSDPEIKIDFNALYAGASNGNLTNVIVNNVRIIDNLNVNYEILDITAYEWRNDINDWKEDVEFIMEYNQVDDLSVVLVLDTSESLGEDFETIKTYAVDFIEKLFTNKPNTRLGIVAFSNVIQVYPISSDRTQIIEYIKNLEKGPFTTLYEAIDIGLDMLAEDTGGGKAILTFTDGTDNNSNGVSANSLFNKISGDDSKVKVNSFTIGLAGKGGVDKPVLESLAANGGVAEFPETIEELGEVFEKFSKSISNVYNLTYIRNDQIIRQNNAAKLKFVIKAKQR